MGGLSGRFFNSIEKSGFNIFSIAAFMSLTNSITFLLDTNYVFLYFSFNVFGTNAPYAFGC